MPLPSDEQLERYEHASERGLLTNEDVYELAEAIRRAKTQINAYEEVLAQIMVSATDISKARGLTRAALLKEY